MSEILSNVPPLPAPFIVGIDLGTTNCAVSYVETRLPHRQVETFAIPQLVAPGQVEALETLPSFLYLAAKGEFPPGTLRLPWSEGDPLVAVGVFAREQGKLVPGRVIESAKSWLCHAGVDRTSALLPWHASEDVPRLSPVEASAEYLGHIRRAWNHVHPDALLEEQDVVITLPASFDEVARELTVEAAKLAGLPRIVLIEEPQAAFYAWIDAHEDHWQQMIAPGQNILVCDIGGGTTDFTLIRVRSQPDGQVQFARIAVGDHLILGGDNMDLALAHMLESRLVPGGRLDHRPWGSLVRICRHAKETLLADDAPEAATVTLPGSGSRLIGGGLSTSLTRDEARGLVVSGFFPEVSLTDRPVKKGSGFQEFGLPYAADAAVTRYLAAFLLDHCVQGLNLEGEGSKRPDVVLFNGGVFVSSLLRDLVVQTIRNWFSGDDPQWTPQVLKNERHDLSVARGAAYYGMVRRGQGVRIAAGLPRTYYIGVATTAADRTPGMKALCLIPAGTEPGTDVVINEYEFNLGVAQPVEFPLFHSSLRLTDRPGELVPVEREQLTPLPPIRTVLRSRKEKEAAEIPVQLHARLSEIGTLQVWCKEDDGSRTWQLQFDVRSATQTDREAHSGTGESAGVLDEQSANIAYAVLRETFTKKGAEKPAGLPKRLARSLEMSREHWPPSLLRQMWEMLMYLEPGRHKSVDHEARWLNLLGYSLRPGYGVALDDWRVSETWKALRGKLAFSGTTVLTEWWILWRRIAGGLAAGQQQSLATPLLTAFKEQQRRATRPGQRPDKRRVQGNPHEKAESWRMLGSLERLPLQTKVPLGDLAVELLADADRNDLEPALLWAIGRIGSREPFYGPLNEVVPIEAAERWIAALIAGRHHSSERLLAVMQLTRKTGDRYRDIGEAVRESVLNWLTEAGAPKKYVELVMSGGELEEPTAAMVFGESLPVGLRLR